MLWFCPDYVCGGRVPLSLCGPYGAPPGCVRLNLCTELGRCRLGNLRPLRVTDARMDKLAMLR
eukprot:scaffold7926_cov31-Tisochrysis_lutea.AAC.2